MKKRDLILLVVILFAAFWYFWDTTSYYFISDDFEYLSFIHLSQVFVFQKDLYHYNPVFWLVMWAARKVFGLAPDIFHLLTVIVHLVNVVLFYVLAKKIIKNTMGVALGTVMFAFFFSHYEVVYWVTGLNTTLMVFFYLMGILATISFVAKPTLGRYLLFLLLFVMCVLTHEYGVSLLGVFLLYWLFWGKGRSFKRLFELAVIPFIFILFLAGAKYFFSGSSLVVNTPTISRFAASVIKSYLYLLLPFPRIIDGLPKAVLVVLFIILMGGVGLLLRRGKREVFFCLWLTITIVVFAATSVNQARYFYLSSVPATLLITSILSRKVYGWLFLSLILTSSLIFLNEQKRFWSENTRITKNILESVGEQKEEIRRGSEVYFVNLPDSVNGPPWNAYVWRKGLERAIELRYGFYPQKLYYLRTIPVDEKVREDRLVSQEEIEDLTAKGGLVFDYESGRGTVRVNERKL